MAEGVLDRLVRPPDTPPRAFALANQRWSSNKRTFDVLTNQGKPVCAYFRPPGLEPFVRGAFVEWSQNTALHLRVVDWSPGTLEDTPDRAPPDEYQGDEAEPSVRVDFGPYFDVPIPAEATSDDWPDWPENHLPEVLGAENRTLRYRTFRGRLVHHLYNLTFFTPVEVLRMPHLSSEKRLWARNQFVFWANQGKKAERGYLDVVRKHMARRAGLPDPEPGKAPVTGEFVAWLHAHFADAMRRATASIDARVEFLERDREIAEGDEPDLNVPDAIVSVRPRLDRWRDRGEDSLRARIEASLWAFHNVFASEMRAQVSAMRLPEILPDELDDENDGEAFENRSFPAQSAWAYHWAQAKLSLGALDGALRGKTWYARFQDAGDHDPDDPDPDDPDPDDPDPDDPDPDDPDVVLRDDRRLDDLFVDPAIDDTLSRIMESELLVQGQIGALQSHVGTRAHLRASLVLTSRRGAVDVVDDGGGEGTVPVDKTFFPATAATRDPPPDAPVAFERSADGSRSRIRTAAYEFMTGTSDPELGVPRYTAFLESEKRGNFRRVRALVERAFASARGDECTDFRIVGVEIPLIDPRRMYEGGANGAFRFFTTQADFVGVATFRRGGKRVVVGEIKTLIERASTQRRRIRDPRSLAQTVYNAYLFREQTRVEVDGVLQLFLTRRTRLPDARFGTVAYGACFSTTARDLDTVGEMGNSFRLRGGRKGLFRVHDAGGYAVDLERDARGARPRIVPGGNFSAWMREGNPAGRLEARADGTRFDIRPREGANLNALAIPVDRIQQQARDRLERFRRRRARLPGIMEEPVVNDNGDQGDDQGDDQDGGQDGDQDGGQDGDQGGDQAGDQGGDQGGDQAGDQGAVDALDDGPAGGGLLGFGAGISTFREPPPAGFERDAREYPGDEPAGNKASRRLLRDAVLESANVIVTTEPVAGRFDATVRGALGGAGNAARAYRWWSRRLRAIARFGPIDVVHAAGGVAVGSGPRMVPDRMMNPLPTEADFLTDPRAVLLGLVIRALHRYVDDFVLRAVELLNPEDARTRDGIDKVELSKLFLHNSQRAFWRRDVLEWARAQIVPVARNEVFLALS